MTGCRQWPECGLIICQSQAGSGRDVASYVSVERLLPAPPSPADVAEERREARFEGRDGRDLRRRRRQRRDRARRDQEAVGPRRRVLREAEGHGFFLQ